MGDSPMLAILKMLQCPTVLHDHHSLKTSDSIDFSQPVILFTNQHHLDH